MTNLATRLGAVLLVLLVSAVMGCTPGGGGGTSAPGVTGPSAAPSSVGGPGAGY